MEKQVNLELGLLQCPISGEKLLEDSGYLVSSRAKFKLHNGYWDLCPPIETVYSQELVTIWTQLQENGVVSYKNAPKQNLGVGERNDYIQFSDFCNFKGRVLDVGVGPQPLPTHLEYSQSKDFQFIGIDPLIGETPKQFAFVRGFGEKLPFKDKIFDQVLFVTSLDHFISPFLALKEAKRVLNNGGNICIWVGEKSPLAPKPVKSPEWYLNLKIPVGADDPFHYKRFSIEELRTFLREANLEVIEWKSIKVDEYRDNHFIRCV